jgi:phosphoglycerate dehydrogenase-like enzyme
MPHKLAVFDTRLLPEAKVQIQALTTEPIDFPESRCLNEQELIRRTGNADIVLISPSDKLTASYLDACPSIKYVCICGTSTANVDLDGLTERGIAYNNVRDYGDESAAEFIFMQLTRLMRGVGDYQWKPEQRELMGKSVGVIGLGALGKAIAHLALSYKMNTSYYSLHRKLEWEDKGLRYDELPKLLQSNEIIIVSSSTNVRVLGEREFGLMVPGSVLVQASAGNVLDKSAFLDWIAEDGNYAIFDMSAGESNYRAYKDSERVIFADVFAGYTQEALGRLGQKVVSNVRNYLASNEER